MWRWVFVILLVLSTTATQPIYDDDRRPSECCPCPKAPDMATLATNPMARSDFVDDCPCRPGVFISNPEGGFTRLGNTDQALASSAGDGTFVRAGVVDDCPCRLRDADSVGAPSGFFPSAMRALWPVVSDKETKGDTKPLLHPEVGLASSVLETLRQATDEEYQEAVARDAVKSIHQAPSIDVISDVSSALDKARNIVNVLIKPDDRNNERSYDSDSEASHVQESRCVQPLERSNSVSSQYTPSSINEKFTTSNKEPVTVFHNNRNIWDMDSSLGASDIHERITDGTAKGLEGLKLKSNPSLLNLFPGRNNNEPVQQINIKSNENSRKPLTNFNEVGTSESSLDKLNRQINNSLSDLKYKLDNHLQSIKNDNADMLKNVLDSVSSPSVPNLVLKPLLPTTKLELTTIKPFPLNSLLNLKDVEFVTPVKSTSSDFNRARSNVPNLVNSNHNNKESSIDLFKNFNPSALGDLITNGLKISLKNGNGKKGTDNIQLIPNRIFKSAIVDADTSPSEIKINIDQQIRGSKHCDDASNSLENDKSFVLSKAKNIKILEKLPFKTNKQNKNNIINNTDDCVNESTNNNINDINKINDKIPNTEIIDIVPNTSKTQHIKLKDDIEDTDEDFNTARNESECETFFNTEGGDSGSLRDLDEHQEDKDVDGDFENDGPISNEMNVSDNFHMEDGAENTEENCFNQDDSLPATSNNLPNIVENVNEQRSDSTTISKESDSNEDCVDDVDESKLDLHTKQKTEDYSDDNSSFKKEFASFKENVLRKFNEIKKPTIRITIEENKNSEKSTTNSKENNMESSEENVDLVENSSKNLDIQDLQNMSDKLLELSSKKDQVTLASEKNECDLHNRNVVSNKKQAPFDSVDAKILENDFTDPSRSIESDLNEDNTPQSTNIINNINGNDEHIEQKLSCSSDFGKKSNFEISSNENEMTADGSDPNIDTLAPEDGFETTLLHNILHPKVFGIDSNLKKSNLDAKDILKLPSFDDVRENLESILAPKFRLSSKKEESEIYDPNTMSVDASAPTFKSVLPTLQPLEDIDLDIFQLRPLTLTDPKNLLSKKSSLPRLNLNSYKAKLAVPKGLHLKPMKLESSLGGKNGLLGATLRIGPDKGSFKKGSGLLSGPLGLDSLPTLEELHSNMRENAQNLLMTPLHVTGRNIIDDSLRSSQTLTDNIRSHAKNTMKDIQQTLETTLKDVKQSDMGILADPLKDPQEFIQAVSRTHEDVTDKLKAIHYDFNDRLESIRDHITDRPLLLPTLNWPMRESSFIFGPDRYKEKSSLLSTSYNKPQKKLKATGKSKSHSNSRVSSPKSNQIKSKIIKMPASQSISVPKTVEAPKLKTLATSSSPPFVFKHSSLRTPQLLTNKKGIMNILQQPVSHFRESKIPVFGKLKPVENKVKISFGSTTIKPELSRKEGPSLLSRPAISRKSKQPTKVTSPVKSGASRIGSKLRPFDANGAPSVIAPIKIKPDNTVEAPKTTIPVLPKSKSLLNKPQNNDNRFTNGHAGSQFSSIDRSAIEPESKTLTNSKLLGSPKNSDILASLREAVRARLSNLTPLSNDKIVQPDSSMQPDMLRSASENVEATNVDGLMRENASYTCKMMCTRNN